MIKIKHLMDEVEPDDGQRLWVESIGLTKDLRAWCRVDHVLPHLGPPRLLWRWFGKNPGGYEHFRNEYHRLMEGSPYQQVLRQIARRSQSADYTLLHTGDDPDQNTATALAEHLDEMRGWVGRGG